MTNDPNEPFRSRPRVRPTEPEAEQPAAQEPASEPTTELIDSGFDPFDDNIIDGVIEEEHALVPFELDPTAELPPPTIDYPSIPDQPTPTAQPQPSRLPRPGLFLVAVGLLSGGIFFTLLNVADLPTEVVDWWPLVSLAVAMLWTLTALIRRRPTAFLAGAAVAGLSMSLLLDAQDVARFRETFIGIILISIGLAIIVRGLLLRQVIPS